MQPTNERTDSTVGSCAFETEDDEDFYSSVLDTFDQVAHVAGECPTSIEHDQRYFISNNTYFASIHPSSHFPLAKHTTTARV